MVAGTEPAVASPGTTQAVGPAGERARRPALDGLRAVAVLLVLVAHFGPDNLDLHGGTLGVDVFFVLSGYLITGLLMAPGALRPRGLAWFWFRRARRLLPPLFAVCLLTTLVIWYAAPPAARPEQRSDVLAALMYTANWHLIAVRWWNHPPYLPPLANTWSLAVEEQFYLLWPLLLAAVLWFAARHRWGSSRPAALGLAGLGMVLSLAWTAGAYTAAFRVTPVVFSTWMRAQQLLAGAALALAAPAVLRWARRRGRAAVLAVAGAMVLAGSVAIDLPGRVGYYEGGELLVAASVVAIIIGIEAAPERGPARVLAVSPLVAVGRISYGVYLFNHPLLAFLPLPGDGSPAAPVQLTRLALTFGLATLSFLMVERPLAAGRLPLVGASVPRQLGLLAGGAAVTVAACMTATAPPASGDDQASARASLPGGWSSSNGVLVGPHASTTRGMIIGRRR